MHKNITMDNVGDALADSIEGTKEDKRQRRNDFFK